MKNYKVTYMDIDNKIKSISIAAKSESEIVELFHENCNGILLYVEAYEDLVTV